MTVSGGVSTAKSIAVHDRKITAIKAHLPLQYAHLDDITEYTLRVNSEEYYDKNVRHWSFRGGRMSWDLWNTKGLAGGIDVDLAEVVGNG